MLELRRATVIDTPPDGGGASAPAGEQRLRIELAGASSPEGEGTQVGMNGRARVHREAIADVALVGRCEVGDELIVNVQALNLGLGSGGFDVVHVNLTRGLDERGDVSPARPRVMKLAYTSLQHCVRPVERGSLQLPVARPTAVLALHGQLTGVAWAFAQAAPKARLGYVQTWGGALPGGHSRTVRTLRERGLLAGHLTAGAAFGGEGEAISVAGALHHGLRELGWDAAVCGPGPGIVGSSSALGHGGLAALDSAHVALALDCPTLLVARMSCGDRRERHRGISHHTLTVLDLLLEPVTVALPAGMRSPVGADLRAGLRSVFPFPPTGTTQGRRSGAMPNRPALALASSPEGELGRPTVERPARIARHDWRRARVDLPGFAAGGLAAETMGRGLLEDPLFFAAALAGGGVLADLVADASAASGVEHESAEPDGGQLTFTDASSPEGETERASGGVEKTQTGEPA